MTKKKQGKSIARIITAIAFVAFFATFVISSYKAISQIIESKTALNAYANLIDEVDDSETIPEDKKEETILTQKVSRDFTKLKKINSDIIGWIKLEGTIIDYPVLRTSNNDFYLYHLYNKRYNKNGSIYVDYRNTKSFTDRSIVIYGHNRANGSMFHVLMGYKDQIFYDNNPVIMLYTPSGDYRIELFCGTIENGNEEFVRFDFNSDNDFMSYINSFRERSTFVSNVEVTAEDKIVSMSTCTYETDNARYCLMGKLVPVME